MLYDAIKRQGYKIPECPVFEITNVAKFCEEAVHWEEWGEKELAKISGAFPPFSEFFMEYDDIFYIKPPEGSFWKNLKLGMLWRVIRTDYGWVCNRTCFQSYRLTQGSITKEIAVASDKNPEDILRGTHIPYFATIPPFSLNDSVCFHINKNGEFYQPRYDIYIGRVKERHNDWTDEQCAAEVDFECAYNMRVPLAALMFMNMHSKCVRISDRVSPRGERRQAEKEGMPLTSFKVLEIRPVSSSRDSGTSFGDTGIQYREHICRGHRAVYRDEDGHRLFGKLHGSFWISSSIRGSRDIGTAEKFYQVATS